MAGETGAKYRAFSGSMGQGWGGGVLQTGVYFIRPLSEQDSLWTVLGSSEVPLWGTFQNLQSD